MRILMTGGTGFLGRNLVCTFQKLGHTVIVLKRDKSDLSFFTESKNLLFFNSDFSNLANVFQDNKIDIIIHTATQYGRNNESLTDLYNTNFMFPLLLIDLAIKHNIKYFINTDTFYDKFFNYYSLSKSHFKEIAHTINDISFINLTIHQMYGPFDNPTKFIPFFIKELLNSNKNKIDLSPGEQLRDYIYITDVVHAYNLIINNIEKSADISHFNICTGQKTKFKDVVEKIYDIITDIRPEVSKIYLNFSGINYIPGELMDVDNDNNSLYQLGWQPEVNLHDGLTEVVRSFLEEL